MKRERTDAEKYHEAVTRQLAKLAPQVDEALRRSEAMLSLARTQREEVGRG